jgi:hypothetical protein
MDILRRFLKKVEKTDSCWLWTAYKNQDGYGLFNINGKSERAHRASYVLFVGEIPNGMVVRHYVCDNSACVNPDHLKLGTQKDNIGDAVRKGRNRFTRHEPEVCGGSKLTSDQVLQVKKLLSAGAYQEYIARILGVSQSAISRIKLGKTWKNVANLY